MKTKNLAISMGAILAASACNVNNIDKVDPLQKMLTISTINGGLYVTPPLVDENQPAEVSEFFKYVPNAEMSNFEIVDNQPDYMLISADLYSYDKAFVVTNNGNPRNMNVFYGQIPAEDPTTGRHKIMIELYLAKKTQGLLAPLVVYLPSLGSKSSILEQTIGSKMAKSGFSSLMVYPDLTPSATKHSMLDINNFFIRNTISIRQSLSFVFDRLNPLLPTITYQEKTVVPALDINQIYAMGVSLGAIRMPYLLAAEPRIKRGGIIMGGGNLPDLLTESQERSVVEYRENQYKTNQLVPNKEAFRAILKSYSFMDPNDLVKYVHINRVTQVITLGDNVVATPFQYELYSNIGKELGESMNGLSLKRYDFDYYGKWFVKPFVEAYQDTNNGNRPPEGHFDLASRIDEVAKIMRDAFNRKRLDPNSLL